MIKLIIAIAVATFLFLLWWGCWFIRDGPQGGRGWAFAPIIITEVLLVVFVIIMAQFLEKD